MYFLTLLLRRPLFPSPYLRAGGDFFILCFFFRFYGPVGLDFGGKEEEGTFFSPSRTYAHTVGRKSEKT